ncbi:hypothetical protein JYU34_004032 [Plutella xylostella]|uniref:Uncharacterized protein n=1 Tax=Plutella xylostella TaxID=51655 RepID=A0ABQ7QWZ7_PLUXY|nr:hypothetical protein JYU34_004032 [Plutella xylostella]
MKYFSVLALIMMLVFLAGTVQAGDEDTVSSSASPLATSSQSPTSTDASRRR